VPDCDLNVTKSVPHALDSGGLLCACRSCIPSPLTVCMHLVEVEAAILGVNQFNSKYPNPPGYSLGHRRGFGTLPDVDPRDAPLVSSAFGRQPLGGRATAPAVSFTKLERLPTPQGNFAPNPFSYKPNVDFVLPRRPAFKMTGCMAAMDADEQELAVRVFHSVLPFVVIHSLLTDVDEGNGFERSKVRHITGNGESGACCRTKDCTSVLFHLTMWFTHSGAGHARVGP
jgi:hypothetical protein